MSKVVGLNAFNHWNAMNLYMNVVEMRTVAKRKMRNVTAAASGNIVHSSPQLAYKNYTQTPAVLTEAKYFRR
ncbi:hypothetical protein ACFSHT_19680 [Paraburkholderia silviterrae]|uniref:Uncharacterized protein n=1 Tax=Paraburkholderia silviterrae TaxID=2528715 RepID=A0A4R5LYZ7_9BURK|nr:hypothetical protein [Paraburkholderia silviterrae]TDG17398.1 hypothetical protein EYW47_37775 [Paraburkholderia silviterrae]